MKKIITRLLFASAFALPFARAEIHVWQKVELTFHAQQPYENPYGNVDVWVDLQGPEFSRRCYGFWDGGDVFRVRVLATAPGKWTWRSGSNQNDPGLNGRTGDFTAAAWTEEEKAAVSLRRGFIRPTANGHAFEFPDGTPFLLVGDTWYAATTNRFKWNDDDRERPIGPEAGFKDYVRLRKRQGYNAVAMIAAFPNWANDGLPWNIMLDRAADLGVRGAWANQTEVAAGGAREQWHAKDMVNEGGRAFLFPGRVPGYEKIFPDVTRLNPEYFKAVDRKIDYLNAQGFLAGLEVARRDLTSCWAKYYPWPESYTRYIQYVWSRYQANACFYSPVHYDWPAMTATTEQLNAAANLVIERYGHPPFGTLASCNASVSSLINFGGPEQNKWLTFHQTGNEREHDCYWYLTEIYHATPARPALNGEPYYSGLSDKRSAQPYRYGAVGGTEADDRCVRSGIYGNFLSGGFAGHIYGAQGIWGADVEPGSDPPMWDAFLWNSGNQMTHFAAFVLSEGRRYADLVPDANLVTPHEAGPAKGYAGWAYAARTPAMDFFLVYFEKDCPAQSQVRGARPKIAYNAQWFDPRTGQWSQAGDGPLRANAWGRIVVPKFPSADDWGLKLTLIQ